MTAICPGGGASQLRPGAGQAIVFSAALITEGLGIISPWLLPLAALIDSFVWQASTQCQGDPPAIPSSSSLSPSNAIGGILNPNFNSWLTAVNNLLLNWAWQQYCECVSGTATAPTYPQPPSGVGGSAPTGGTPCFTGSFGGTPLQETTPTTLRPETPQLRPNGTMANYPFGAGQIAQTVAINPGAYTAITFTGTVTFDPAGSKPYVIELNEFDSSGTFLSNPSFSVPWSASPATFSHTFSIGPSVGAIGVETAQVNETHPATVQVTAVWTCGAGGAAAGPCQPCTDPGVLEVLNTILQLVEAVYQASPVTVSAYSEGTTHSGLSGSGVISIAPTTIGVRVNITTDLPGGRIDLGSPNYLFDRGYIVEIAVEAPVRGYSRLVYNPQVFQLLPITEQIGYTLPVGEVISITELSRAP